MKGSEGSEMSHMSTTSEMSNEMAEVVSEAKTGMSEVHEGSRVK